MHRNSIRPRHSPTPARLPRRVRWLLYAGLVFVSVVSNRCAVACHPLTQVPTEEPAGAWVYR
ncbi:MAG: hypothetical protein ACRYG7_11515 [Janthinobacterium lividum]